MSRKNRRNKVKQVEIARPQNTPEGSLIASFAAKVDQPLRNSNDLMNYIIFGDPKKTFTYSNESF